MTQRKQLLRTHSGPGGVRSVPSVSIEATEHQSEAPADGLVCAFWLRLTLKKQYSRLESDAWCGMKGKMQRKKEKDASAKKKKTSPEPPVTL
jgi:hypothetical protein